MGASYRTTSITDRMMRAARLDSQVYEEVEHDLSATSQALTVVIITAVAAGIGHAVGELMGGHPGRAVGGFIGGVGAALLGWVIWSLVSYFVGTKLFGGIATPGELLRTIGFAHAPGIINVILFIPILGGLIGIVVAVWQLIATIVAMRQALDIDTGKAVLTALVGMIPAAFLSLVLIGPFMLLFGR